MYASDTTRDQQISRCRCHGGAYRGWTFAVNDGASRLAPHFDRIVVQCDECGARLSIPTARAGIPLDTIGRPRR